MDVLLWIPSCFGILYLGVSPLLKTEQRVKQKVNWTEKKMENEEMEK